MFGRFGAKLRRASLFNRTRWVRVALAAGLMLGATASFATLLDGIEFQ
jgi:hypothetical protein